MRKRILLAVIITLTAYESISQTSKDTVCLPVAQVKKAINLIERGKVADKELELSRGAITLLEKRISVKDSIISAQNLKEEAYKSIVANYKQSVSNSEEIVSNLEKSLVLERRRARRQGFMKWLGIAAGFGIGYLIAK